MNYEEFIRKVRSLVCDYNDFMFGKDMESCRPNWNISSRKQADKEKATYAVKFYESKEFFAIWDLKRHRDLKATTKTLYISESWDDIKFSIDAFVPYYRTLETPDGDNFEKVYVVGLQNVEKFFQDYASYMEMNTLDDEFPQKSEMAKKAAAAVQWHNETEREKYSSSRYKRDARFRSVVLSAYNYQCAVCRCRAVKLLQAAHERDYDVASTNHDDPKHGICLCANHHLMYDNFLIDLDLKTNELRITGEGISEQIEDMPWYREFQEKYKGRLLRRIDHA
jgi:hypothetical protein